mmetsp:Transcript_13785/g.44958  ORF Transcript_13785/g.44958 Transcript_13785/m.44958 type:complete len:291 (+) Transcript_13785:282-1154(+)
MEENRHVAEEGRERPPRLGDDGEEGAFDDFVAFVDEELLDGAGGGGLDLDFHFHGGDDEEFVAGVDGLAEGDVDLFDDAGHGRGHVGRVGGVGHGSVELALGGGLLDFDVLLGAVDVEDDRPHAPRLEGADALQGDRRVELGVVVVPRKRPPELFFGLLRGGAGNRAGLSDVEGVPEDGRRNRRGDCGFLLAEGHVVLEDLGVEEGRRTEFVGDLGNAVLGCEFRLRLLKVRRRQGRGGPLRELGLALEDGRGDFLREAAVGEAEAALHEADDGLRIVGDLALPEDVGGV